jgi:putative transposase
MLYMDLNMVRAGVVSHPSEWCFSGYNEIQVPRERYALIDYAALKGLLGFNTMGELAVAYRGWVDESVGRKENFRESMWTESVAVGSRSFVDTTREKLGIKVRGREVIEKNGSYELRESPAPYRAILGDENNSIRLQNAYFLNDNV